MLGRLRRWWQSWGFRQSEIEGEGTSLQAELEQLAEKLDHLWSFLAQRMGQWEAERRRIKELEAQIAYLRQRCQALEERLSKREAPVSTGQQAEPTSQKSESSESDPIAFQAATLQDEERRRQEATEAGAVDAAPLTVPLKREAEPEAQESGASAENAERRAATGRSHRQRRSPERRGGRPRKTLAEKVQAKTAPRATISERRGERIELMCWQRGGVWECWLFWDQPFADNAFVQMRQGDQWLEGNGDTGWRLASLTEVVEIVQVDASGQSQARPIWKGLPEDRGLLFRLDRQTGRGRRVARVSRGWYLAMVPAHWECADAPPVAPEPTAFSGYRAHYFYFERPEEAHIRFRIHGRERTLWQRVVLELRGERLPDAAVLEGRGPLFRSPPVIWAEPRLWQTIRTIVIVEEGKDKQQRWRMQFTPNSEPAQPLPQELAERGGGWYALRFYDANEQLIESLDFRFLEALEAIQIDPETAVLIPTEQGHSTVRLIFRHQPACRIEPQQAFPEELIQRLPNQTLVQLPADKPQWDRTYWQASVGSVAVELCVDLPRIWWALARGSEQKGAKHLTWQAQPLQLTRQDFSAVSDTILYLKLPATVRQVCCGFPEDLRPFQRPAGAKEVKVPLREFYDIAPHYQTGTIPFLMQIDMLTPVEVARLILSRQCAFCEFTTEQEQALLAHLLEEHGTQLYRKAEWHELRQKKSELPREIYQCKYCDEYVEVRGNYPTSEMLRHQEQYHKGKQERFEVVSDPDVIREKITKYKDLPRFYVCKLCGTFLDISRDEGVLRQHMRRCHWDAISRWI
ncbi:hypothetical protein [Rhodothermus profundi]|uniref:C2H2-type domain-containing protein n=1 Tax=Rhodothermus profundi TaxID=633813 RepID=A0A1M6WMA6_9BACT|nr:hypothetical protein [Rhodothermus profundi]SHK94841.1 hypothetical protein SAMN04488087_2353 [Rhodothermus profundi]